MKLAIRGIESNLGYKNTDTFHNDLYKTLKADYEVYYNELSNISIMEGGNASVQ